MNTSDAIIWFARKGLGPKHRGARWPRPVVRGMRSFGNRAKPLYGSPCNSCGHCCASELCGIAEAIMGEIPAPCPAMVEHDDGTYGCGVVENPAYYDPVRIAKYGEGRVRVAAMLLLGFGVGCDSHDRYTTPLDELVLDTKHSEPGSILARFHAGKLWDFW